MTKNDDDNSNIDLARRPQPVTDELRTRVAELHAAGLGRNAIAREVRVSGATVSKIAREHKPPLEFDREAAAFALRARQVDLATIRETLARKFLAAADDSLDMLDDPVTIGQFGGSDNTWNETLVDSPTIEQRNTLIRTAEAAARKGIELLKVDAEAGSVSARGIVAELRDTLTRGLDALEAAGQGVDPTATPEQPAGT